MYKLLLSILCVFVINIANSQSKDSTTTLKKHHVGSHASSLGGVGLSYRFWPGKLGVQVTVLPIFRENNGHFLSLGATALYSLNKGKTVDLYGYWGNHFISNSFSNSTTNNSYNTGLGFGFKINFSELVNFNIQTGYGFYNINNSFTSTIAGGAGLYFSF